MKAIIGLGNPGPEYQKTRHNAGFRVIDELLRRKGWGDEREKRSTLGGQTVRYRYAERKAGSGSGPSQSQSPSEGPALLAIKPLTFMNASGSAFVAALKDFGLEPGDALVVSDDVSLPLGKLRLKPAGSSGGQKGLKDILETAGTDRIARLRFGVGAENAPADLAAFVLADFASQEEKLLTATIARAADAAQTWAERGIEEAMNKFNGTESV